MAFLSIFQLKVIPDLSEAPFLEILDLSHNEIASSFEAFAVVRAMLFEFAICNWLLLE
jgi:Leucine-rich repeat (LRR) protein